METLTLRWNGENAAEWCEAGRARCGSLTEAVTAAAGRSCVVLVPGSDVLLMQANIRSRRRADVERALPYAFEEWLVEPPETQHYAWSRTVDGIAAAIVSRARLDAWREQLSTAGLVPEVLLPETLALPWQQGEWSLALAGDDAWLRTGSLSGYACDRNVLPILLGSLWTALPEAGRPERMRVQILDGELPDGLPLQVVHGARAEFLACVFLKPEKSLNLLSGPYAPRQGLSARFGPWRIAAAAAMLFLLSVFGLHVAQYVQLTHEAAKLQARIDTVFHASVPNEERVVDAKVQMQQALDALTADGGRSGSALVLLADTADVFAKQRGLRITELAYRKGRLALQLTGPDLSAIEDFKTQLQLHGLDADLSAVSKQKGVSRGHLDIRKGGHS